MNAMSAERQMTKVAEEVLRQFWNLTDDDPDIRRQATEELIDKIQVAQEIHSKTQSDTKESPLLKYCLSRLFTGMASDQFMARESFAIGLTTAFHALPSFHLIDFLNSMDTYLRIKPDIPFEKQVDTCIGRLLGYSVCLQLGYHRQQGLQCILRILTGLFELYLMESSRQLCAVNLIELLLDVNDEILQRLFSQSGELRSLYTHPVNEASPEDFLICLTLWNSTPDDLLEQSSMLPVKHRPKIKHWFKAIDGSYSKIADSIFAPDRLELILPLFAKTSKSHPKLHVLWEILIQLLLCDVEKFSVLKTSNRISDFWRMVINDLSMGDNEQKYLSQSLSLRIMQRVNAAYIPYFIRGPYWTEIRNAVCSDQSLLHQSSLACIEQIMELVKQAPRDKIDCFLPMLISRFPKTSKIESMRTELLEFMIPGVLDSYITDLIHCLLNWPDPDIKKTLRIAEMINFDSLEILEDLKNAFKLHRLNPESIELILKILVCLSLTKMKSLDSAEDSVLELVSKSRLETNKEFRIQCVTCLMSCCLLMDHSLFSKTSKPSPLSSVLQILSLLNIELIHEEQEEVKTTRPVIRSLDDGLHKLLSEKQDQNEKQRQIKSLCDLLCILKVYYYGDPSSVDYLIFEDLLKIVEKLSGDTEEDSEEMMETLMETFINLCTRRTDPYPFKLLLKFIRASFNSFISKMTFPVWCTLLEALTKVDSFDVEMDGGEVMEVDQASQELDLEEEELTSEEENLDEMKDFLFDADFTQEEEESHTQLESQQQLAEDLNSAVVRILWFVESVLKRNPTKEFVLITPIQLWIAMRGQEDDQVKKRYLRVLKTLLKCKPKIERSHLELIKSKIIQFMKELPSKAESRDLISKIFRFLVSRLMASVEQCQECLELVVEMLKIAIQHQFRKSGHSILPETIHSVLKQHRSISRRILPALVDAGLELKNPHNSNKGLELIHTCLQDKDPELLRPVVGLSQIEEVLLKTARDLPNRPTRIHMELVLTLSRVTRSIQKIMKLKTNKVISKDKFGAVLMEKIKETKTAKMKRKLIELTKELTTNT